MPCSWLGPRRFVHLPWVLRVLCDPGHPFLRPCGLRGQHGDRLMFRFSGCQQFRGGACRIVGSFVGDATRVGTHLGRSCFVLQERQAFDSPVRTLQSGGAACPQVASDIFLMTEWRRSPDPGIAMAPDVWCSEHANACSVAIHS